MNVDGYICKIVNDKYFLYLDCTVCGLLCKKMPRLGMRKCEKLL